MNEKPINNTERKAWIITRKDGLRAMNEGIEVLRKNGVEQFFRPYTAIGALMRQRSELIYEIKELEAMTF